jgi:uncharacterized protein YkwD
LDTEEAAFLFLINQYRAQNGLGALQIQAELQADAVWMADDMAQNNFLGHTDTLGRDPFVRMTAFGFTGWNSAAENVAAGNADAQATFDQWKSSPGHNANMLGASYHFMGIGRAQNPASTYAWYWSTPFGS